MGTKHVGRFTLFREIADKFPGFLSLLTPAIKPVLVPRNGDILTPGQLSTEMYFIFKGKVEVRDIDAKLLYEKSKGEFFGEVVFMIPSGIIYKLVVKVRAIQDTFLFVLDKSFLDVLETCNTRLYHKFKQVLNAKSNFSEEKAMEWVHIESNLERNNVIKELKKIRRRKTENFDLLREVA